MKCNRTCAVLLTGALLAGGLTGCGKTETDRDMVQELMGYSRSTAMFTVNGETVTADDYFYELAYVCSMAAQGFTGPDGTVDWTQDMGGQPLQEVVLDSVQQSLVSRALIREQSAKLGIALTDENKTELEGQIAEVIEAQGGAAVFQSKLQAIPISEAAYRAIYADNYLAQGLIDKLAGKVEDVAEDQAAMDQWRVDQGLLMAKHILFRTKEDDRTTPLSEEAQAAAKAKAEGVLAQLRAAAPGDQAALFDTLMHENSEDPGLATNPDGYFFGPNQMVPVFEEAVKALEINAISDLVESGDGYHIILRLPLPPMTDDQIAQWKQSVIDNTMNGQMRGWLDSAVVETTKEYDALDLGAFYTKLAEVRAELEAASATPTPAPGTTPPSPSAGQ